jgi:TRAP-type C4-dicarboxylate transport system substrate-binding protein
MKKKSVWTWMTLFLALVVLAGSNGLAQAETFTLKAVTGWPKTASEYKAFTMFTDLLEQMVAQKAPGELKIQYIGGPEAVKTPDQVQALQRGMVDLVFTTTAYYVSVLPEVDAYKLSNFTPADELEKQERPLLIKEGLQVIDLPAAEKEKFLQVATEEGWKDVLLKNPQSGPELKKLLTKQR